jgi:hypothetical protein
MMSGAAGVRVTLAFIVVVRSGERRTANGTVKSPPGRGEQIGYRTGSDSPASGHGDVSRPRLEQLPSRKAVGVRCLG